MGYCQRKKILWILKRLQTGNLILAHVGYVKLILRVLVSPKDFFIILICATVSLFVLYELFMKTLVRN